MDECQRLIRNTYENQQKCDPISFIKATCGVGIIVLVVCLCQYRI